jgi:hypothetical protein
MANSGYGASLTTEEFIAAITDQPDPAASAAFAAAILGEEGQGGEPGLATAVFRARAAGVPANELLDAVQFGISRIRRSGLLHEAGFNPDEPRDERGRWTTGAGIAGPSQSVGALALGGKGSYTLGNLTNVPAAAAPAAAPSAPAQPAAPNAPNLGRSANQAEIIRMTTTAGKSPTDAQFWDAVHRVDKMTGGDSTAALGAIMQIRDSGTDNPLLACLDHYFSARSAVETSWVPGLMFAKVLAANGVYSGMKAVGIPVPQDTNRAPSPATELQWMAGNWGAAQGLMSRKK